MLRYVHGLLLVSLSVSCINNIRVVIGPFVSCVGRVDMCTRTVFCSSSWVWTRCGRDARACLAVPRALPAAELRYFTDRWRDFLHTARASLSSPAPPAAARATTRRDQTPLLSSLVPLRRVCVWAGPGAPRAARRGRPRQALGTSAVVCRDGTGCGVAPPAAWTGPGPGPGTWDLHAETCMVVA